MNERSEETKAKLREYDRQYRSTPEFKEARRIRRRKNYAADSKGVHEYSFWYRTGWTQEAYEAAWQRQQGLCAICKRSMTQGSTRNQSAVRDHWEPNGVKTPRDLLHARCNLNLGLLERLLRDDTVHGQPAAPYREYLARHEAELDGCSKQEGAEGSHRQRI
jgi:hypothetical protein